MTSDFNVREWLKTDEAKAATARIEITPKLNGRNRPPPTDDAPPVIGTEDYGVTSSPKVGIVRPKEPAPKKPPLIDWREKAITADKLQGMTFNPVTFVVPGLIPSEGATLICSKPKV